MTWHTRDLTTLAFVWRIERGDGIAIGFTSHDRDLVRGGFVYRAAPGMVPSAIRLSDGLDADDIELDGALTSGAISEGDLLAGRWDGAALSVAAVDWSDPQAEAIVLVRGHFASVAVRDGAFSVGLRGLTQLFDRPVAEATSPSCRAVLGDERCRVDLRGRRRRAEVVALDGTSVTLSVAPVDGVLAFGTLRWIDGDHAGLSARITGGAGAVLTLGEPAAPTALPCAVELVEGCDRQLATCATRFANVANFQGEPHLPGNDLLTRYAQ